MAGYKGGWVDSLLMRFVDIMLSFPSFFLILTVVAILRPNIYNVMIVIGITSWKEPPGLFERISLLEGKGLCAGSASPGGKRSKNHFSTHPPECFSSRLCDRFPGVASSDSNRSWP